MKMFLTLILLLLTAAQFNQIHAQKNGRKVGKSGQKKSMSKQVKYDRLPPEITLQTQAVKEIANNQGAVISNEITTVEKRLKELKAVYRNGVLVDGKGREIRFYEPQCRGVSRGYDGDQEDQKTKVDELAELMKKFTVIVLYCDPRQAV